MSTEAAKTEGASPVKEGTFRDTQGREWVPQLTTPILIEACRKLNIRLNDVMDFSLNVGDLVDVLWYACREAAQERKMTRIDFYEAIPPELLVGAMVALGHTMRKAFPQVGDLFGGGAAGAGPFAPGKFQTLLNSAGLPGSPPASP